MPDDATEGVAEHSSRLQPSINLDAFASSIPAVYYYYYDVPVAAFMFSCFGSYVPLS